LSLLGLGSSPVAVGEERISSKGSISVPISNSCPSLAATCSEDFFLT
jgi:hypothetical protein